MMYDRYDPQLEGLLTPRIIGNWNLNWNWNWNARRQPAACSLTTRSDRRLVPDADQIISEPLDDEGGFCLLDGRNIFRDEDRLPRLDDHASIGLGTGTGR